MILPLLLAAALADFEPPALTRLHPLGGRAGTVVEVEILGSRLETATTVEFDSKALTWEQTTLREPGRIKGLVAIGAHAPLGAHLLRVRTAQGPSSSLLFNVGQFPAFVEGEQRAIPTLPVEIYGRLDGPTDIDTYWFSVKAGERWVFDFHAMEHGSAVETRMSLLDRSGQKIAHNDDRDHYDENPRIERTFETGGIYGVRVDQYRGPRGFTFGKNNAYFLRISALQNVVSVTKMGAKRGTFARLTALGTGLVRVKRAWLTELRRAEYERLTYPHTMPVRFAPDPVTPARIDGKVLSATDKAAELTFPVPASAPPGLWKLWLAGPDGVTEGPRLEIGDTSEVVEGEALPGAFPFVINGLLAKPRERDTYRIQGKAGQPILATTLAAQLGAPFLDTVLTLRDASGRKLVENDDVVAGWGGLLGNPDSALFYTPKEDGPLTLEVRDRLNRGGELYPYWLKLEHKTPSFQLFTTPENPVAKKGAPALLKVHLVREAGFAGEVEVWVEGLPGLKGKFRADQLFEPNADGADMLIPEIEFHIPAPEKPGHYPLRVLGKSADGRVVEGHTAAMIGPIYQGDWNFYRRPMAEIALTVVD